MRWERPQGVHAEIVPALLADTGVEPQAPVSAFVCQGFFARDVPKSKLKAYGGTTSDLTVEAMRFLNDNYSEFLEDFKVTSLGGDRYKITLIPTLIPLAKEYSREFTYR